MSLKIKSPITGRNIKYGGNTFNALLKTYSFVNGELIITKSIEDLQCELQEKNQEISDLKDQVAMMQEAYNIISQIIRFNTIKKHISDYVDFQEMEEIKNWKALNRFLNKKSNRSLLTQIFGYEVNNFQQEYHTLRKFRNEFSHMN